VERIAIDGAGWSYAAFGCRPEAASYQRDFLLIQIASASAKQHSVLIIHDVFSFHRRLFWPAKRARLRLNAAEHF